ncbi:MOSC domain-containing protein [Roseivivax sediminis]|uniref:MOSC domain-containing protein n=1 Tax=Roseivivax sediminis TaxID=936889 RepID=A0A1I2DTU5_9RHOB|nr:MOSC domain-containing protein [Roseivivax sediminis]SFE83828.1 MOSC domain-containing protein [Roseivivax sediminis]
MKSLGEMIARQAQAGRVDWIGLRPDRRGAMRSVPAVELEAGGLAGDHGRAGKRAVTLVQAEHLAAIGGFLGQGPVAPEELRRNLVISGINLAGLKGRRIAIGAAVLRLTTICAPCSRMEEAFGPGGYSAVRGHGGWCAEVLRPGRIALGDTVRALADQSE